MDVEKGKNHVINKQQNHDGYLMSNFAQIQALYLEN